MKKKWVVRYMDETIFDRFDEPVEASLWAEMIDGTVENEEDPGDLGDGVRIKGM